MLFPPLALLVTWLLLTRTLTVPALRVMAGTFLVWLSGLCLIASGLKAFPVLLLSMVLFLSAAALVPVAGGSRFPARAGALLLWLAVVCLARSLQGVPDFAWPLRPHALLFVDRASNLVSGVSPILPIVGLALAFYCLAFPQLVRWNLLRSFPADSPFPQDTGADPQLRQLAEQHGKIYELLRHPGRRILGTHARASFAVLVVLLFVFCRVYSKMIPSVEGLPHDCLFLLALAGFTLFLAYVFGQAKYFWDELHKLIQGIALLPMLKSFDRIPGSVTDMFGPYLSSPGPDRTARRQPRARQLQALAARYPEVRASLEKEFQQDGGLPDRLDTTLAYDSAKGKFVGLNVAALAAWTPSAPAGDEDPLPAAAQTCLRVVQRFWPRRTVEESCRTPPQGSDAPDGKPTAGQTTTPPGGTVEGELQDWLRTAEDFVALEITADLSRFFVQLRNLFRSLTWAPLLAVLALVSYPFLPQRFMLLVAAVVILILVGGAIRVFLQVERDEVISRILKGTPQKIDWSWRFASSLAIYVIPLLGLLAAASANSSDLLHTLLDPISQVLK
jgi:hypothetical protein